MMRKLLEHFHSTPQPVRLAGGRKEGREGGGGREGGRGRDGGREGGREEEKGRGKVCGWRRKGGKGGKKEGRKEGTRCMCSSLVSHSHSMDDSGPASGVDLNSLQAMFCLKYTQLYLKMAHSTRLQANYAVATKYFDRSSHYTGL